MKKIEKLKLNQLSKEELKKRELNQIRGGSCCKCCCGYQWEGDSSTGDNYSANLAAGHTSSYGDICACGSSVPSYEGQCS